MSEMKHPKIGDQKPKNKTDEATISLEDRLNMLRTKAEADFKKYYGEDGERIMNAINKEQAQNPSNSISCKFLLTDIPMYAMYMPESAYLTPKTVLEERARNLFRKSADIFETIQELRQYLQGDLSDNEIKKKKISDYINILSERALKLIKSRFSVHQKQNEATLWYLAQTKSIEKDLEISDEELFLNLHWFKYAKSNIPPPSVEDIIGHKIYTTPSKEVSQSDQSEIIKIYEDNWKLENPNTKKALIDNIKQAFASIDDNSHFIFIKNHKEMVGFIRFEDKGEYEFASALNVREEYKNFGIAQALLDSSLRVRSILHPVHARARLTLDYTKKYIEEFDAIGTSIEDYHGSSHLNMIFSSFEKQKFITHNMTINEILTLSSENIKIEKLKTLSNLTIPADFILTRVISDSSSEIYCVLEKTPKM